MTHTGKPPTHTSHAQLELEALLRFYQKTGGSTGAWKVDTGWPALANAVEQTADALLLRGTLEKQLPLFGVTWERNHVVAVDLSANNLTGGLTKELGHLKSLKRVKLRDNPQLKGDVPKELYRLPRLQYCYVDGTRLANVLPHDDAHSFQITRLHNPSHHDTKAVTATVTFATDRRTGGHIIWIADMSESELFMVSSALKARHQALRETNASELPQRTAANATGPERVAAAIKLQRIYRARIARTKFRRFLKSLFEKQFDAATGFEYFVDTRTGESMWERPKCVAKTPRRDDDSNQELWQAFDDGHGNTVRWVVAGSGACAGW